MTTDASAGLTRYDMGPHGDNWVRGAEADALLADLRGKLAAMTDNRDVLVGQLQAAREHVEAERAKVREKDADIRQLERHIDRMANRPSEPALIASAEREGRAMQYAAALQTAGLALYKAGNWTAANVSHDEQVALWEAFRDALGLAKGTATSLGVAALPASVDAKGADRDA
jgi:hypothetical protein